MQPSVTRDRLALALDVDDRVAAVRLARQLKRWFAVAKVGPELFSAVGPVIVPVLVDEGYRVFLDLKLAEIPATMARTGRVLGSLGVSYLSLHAFVGPVALRAGVTGLAEGASRAGLDPPAALAVTGLISDPPGNRLLDQRVQAASEAHCRGVLCSVPEVAEVKQLAPRMLTVVSGIRHRQEATGNGARLATTDEALAAGADLLVVGQAVTAAADPVAAATVLTGGV